MARPQHGHFTYFMALPQDVKFIFVSLLCCLLILAAYLAASPSGPAKWFIDRGGPLKAFQLNLCEFNARDCTDILESSKYKPQIFKAAIPSEAWLITLPSKEETFFPDMARKEISRISQTLGIAHTNVVYGVYDGRFNDIVTMNQFGLTLAHYQIWSEIVDRNLTGAWIFEDDVIFHSKFDEIFGEYWKEVPSDYELVWLGHNQLTPEFLIACEEENDTKRLIHEHFSFTTHALAVSYNGAHRLKNAMDLIFRIISEEKAQPPHWFSNGGWIIDVFLRHVAEHYMDEAEQYKWVLFDSTKKNLAEWGGVTWCRIPDFFVNITFPQADVCEEFDVEYAREHFSSPMPVVGTGLAYQHWCKDDPEKLNRWIIPQD